MSANPSGNRSRNSTKNGIDSVMPLITLTSRLSDFSAGRRAGLSGAAILLSALGTLCSGTVPTRPAP